MDRTVEFCVIHFSVLDHNASSVVSVNLLCLQIETFLEGTASLRVCKFSRLSDLAAFTDSRLIPIANIFKVTGVD